MKDNRYFQMVYLLLQKGHMTAPELAEHFEVSVRTIYRDIDILSLAGIPVYATQGKGGGIFIQENFVLNKSLLSEEEQKQILMALQGIRIIEEGDTSALLSKLSSVFQKQNTDWFEFDFSSRHFRFADFGLVPATLIDLPDTDCSRQEPFCMRRLAHQLSLLNQCRRIHSCRFPLKFE